jgi:hypothetical protein
LNAYLWKRTGKDRIPVILYSTALLAMSLAALDSRSPKAAAGGALFLMSDTFLALEKYAAVPLPGHQGLVMATYASAQALLAELSMLPIILTEHRRVIPSACQASVTIARYGVRLPGLLPRGWCSTVVSEEGKNTLWWPSRQRTR